MPKLGEKLSLTLKLADTDGTKYPRAEIRDYNGAILAGSPRTLSHLGNGFYFNDDLVMPNSDLFVSYEVFNDAAFSDKSNRYQDAADYIELETDIDLSQVLQADLTGQVENDSDIIFGEVTDESDLDAIIDSETNLDGQITGDPLIIGEIKDDEQIDGET